MRYKSVHRKLLLAAQCDVARIAYFTCSLFCKYYLRSVISIIGILVTKRVFLKCRVCGEEDGGCLCCPEAGHVCPRDWGQIDCPICGPKLEHDFP